MLRADSLADGVSGELLPQPLDSPGVVREEEKPLNPRQYWGSETETNQ